MFNTTKRDRRLADEGDVYNHNAWDDTEWTQEMVAEAEARLKFQRDNSQLGQSHILDVADNWNLFYEKHSDKFFKDRKWIFSEFPELLEGLSKRSEPCNIFEVGCGVGNAVAHLIAANENSNLHIYCCDVSPKAIEVLLERDFYKASPRSITAFQADIVRDFNDKVTDHVAASSIDFVTLIFAMSALRPEYMRKVVVNLSKLLKPGGIVMFRDYARYDMAQLRFKPHSYLADNYYLRADGTTSYFFTTDQIRDIFEGAGLVEVELKSDNRLLVNRLKQMKMCRCWIQAKFMKPISSHEKTAQNDGQTTSIGPLNDGDHKEVPFGSR